MNGMTLGDMEIHGQPPAKLLKALAVIAAHLHDAWSEQPIRPGWSKKSCILCSVTVREFLYKIGFRSADFVPAFLYIDATKDGVPQHSAGIGSPKMNDVLGDGWTGHAVVVVDGWLIDTTLYQIRRPQWPSLPGMVSVPTFPDSENWKIEGHRVLTGFLGRDIETGNDVKIMWMHQPQNDGWRSAPDFHWKHPREKVVRQLVERFGRWKEDAP